MKICSPISVSHQSSFFELAGLETFRNTIGTVADDRIALFTEKHIALSLSPRLSKQASMQETHTVIVVVEVVNERT